MGFREHQPCERFGSVVSYCWMRGARGGEQTGDRVLVEDQRRDGQWLLVVADMEDHGERAEAAANCLVTQLVSESEFENLSPANLLHRLHSRFAFRIAQGDSKTIAAGAFLIDGKSANLIGALAGFYRPIRGAPGRQWQRWEIPYGCLVGYEDDQLQENEDPFAEAPTSLDPGEKTLIYTDGLYDAKHGSYNAENFGKQALQEYLYSLRGEIDGQTLLERLVEALRRFLRGTEPDDDVTVVCLERVE